MSSTKILLIGYGKLMRKLAPKIQQAFTSPVSIDVVRRRLHTEDDVEAPVSVYAADVSQADSLDNLAHDYDYVVYCLSPAERNEAGYRRVFVEGLGNVIRHFSGARQLKRFLFVSSSSVYHQDDSAWVDENSPAKATGYAGRTLREAEDMLLGSGLPATIVRFAGIYGGNRRNLISQLQAGNLKLSDQARLSNRIHEDDCVGFLFHLLSKAMQGAHLPSMYLACDDCPVDLNQVYAFIADHLDITLAHDGGEVAPRRTGNKRCSNKRMRASGYALLYPSYKEGYRELLARSDKLVTR